jgi:hypothetical protein
MVELRLVLHGNLAETLTEAAVSYGWLLMCKPTGAPTDGVSTVCDSDLE